TQRWIKDMNMPRIEAAYGSVEAYKSIPDWSGFRLPPLKEPGSRLDHGYDESKPLPVLTYGELRKAALFRGGRLLAEAKDENRIGDADKALDWQCSEGHRFRLTPRTVLRGGHWCPECLLQMEDDPEAVKQLARKNRFLSQVVPD
ncbi:MAG: NAD(P)-dependent oxidoreductase, partial [Muribaculaceae bacterium]|nr:NAD(P)-dependent oxidoreductase [Muribaculaceae bacterium]